MELVPLTLREAQNFVSMHHRHNEAPVGHKFSIGLRRMVWDHGGSDQAMGDEPAGWRPELVGVVIASRPVGRGNQDGRTIELIRLTTIGDKNACSRLYSAACRAAAAMGYLRAITYTLEDEPGASLRASGFRRDGVTKGGEWTPMEGLIRSAQKMRLWDDAKMPTGPKVRWIRELGDSSFRPATAVQSAASGESGEVA